MNIYIRSMIAGFAATVVLSLLMLVKSAMGLMPQLDVIAMLSEMSRTIMGFDGTGMAWLIHFLIGTVLWGLLFALLYEWLPGSEPIMKGISFSILAWILMMIAPMPMAGAGFFGVALGIMAPVMTLILHMIWGATLGLVFRMLPAETTEAAERRS